MDLKFIQRLKELKNGIECYTLPLNDIKENKCRYVKVGGLSFSTEIDDDRVIKYMEKVATEYLEEKIDETEKEIIKILMEECKKATEK